MEVLKFSKIAEPWKNSFIFPAHHMQAHMV